jgi:hypothetical protein
MAVPAAQAVRMTVTRRALENDGGAKQNEVKYRISKGHGWLMMFTAAFFDLLPLLLIILAISFTMSVTSNFNEKDLARIMACSEAVAGSSVWEKAKCGGSLVSTTGVKVAMTGASAIASGLMFGPILYMVGSLIATLLSFIVFFIWFLLKGVFVLSLKPGRVAANLMVFIVESLPVLNILPGHTLGVAMHVRNTRAEDRERHKNKGGATLAA